jgi:excisionase family DNA binding protein
MSTPDPLQLLTTADLCALLRRSPGWVRKQRKSGALPYLQDGRSIRFRRADVEAFLETLQPGAHLAPVIWLRPAA